MGGERLQEYWRQEVRGLEAAYRQMEALLPAEGRAGAAHPGEDGRYVECLLTEALKRFLPRNLEIFSGFILRPGVKSGCSKAPRSSDPDQHSSQLDLIVYDSANYPVFQRFGGHAVVPPEGVIAVLSVKKHLYSNDLKKEILALQKAGHLCRGSAGDRAPFLALVSMKSCLEGEKGTTVWRALEEAFRDQLPWESELVGYIGAVTEWSVCRKKRSGKQEMEYALYLHPDEDVHWGFQYLLNGIFSVYYSKERNHGTRPGVTAFPSGKDRDVFLGGIPYRKYGNRT
ncbi:hypothetical protein MUB23_14805 [Cuneatibacter sp. NSJ-177]|uniref:DUF6602 domain-containing protein n=1 Tax=Cuneatibacter sp. NSJ-177 TaxID=2931401 RepID=UPI001FCFA8FD|nr:DUF6602 domain-containing protein [Cuneatibacter sp. NSJ-177]MCJ7836657.1 hypothetical protein [Cuneatibacter sp. NSJ-177]